MNVLLSREISEAEKNQEVLNLQQFSSLGVPVNYKDGDNFYLLSGGHLNSVSFNDAQNYMSNFKQDFQNLYGKDTSKKITEYITHNLSDVNNNFLKFETETNLITGAKPDGDALRMNIILSKPTADCKNPTTTGFTAFYNLGTTRS